MNVDDSILSLINLCFVSFSFSHGNSRASQMVMSMARRGMTIGEDEVVTTRQPLLLIWPWALPGHGSGPPLIFLLDHDN